MKVLLLGDSPTVPTGFSRCTKSAADALYAAGHEVLILGIHEKGDPHTHPYHIYPCHQPFDGGFDQWGNGRLPVMIARHQPDVVCILQDPWNIPNYIDHLDKLLPDGYPTPPIVGWLAVDSLNQQGAPLNKLSHVVTWTEFGIHELRAGGYTGSHTVVPLGVDTSTFHPMDKATARRLVLGAKVPDDTFIIGVVGRNQPRKRIDIAIQSFSHFLRDVTDNARLFLHVAPTGDVGYDLKSLCNFYQCHTHTLKSAPDVGRGVADSDMCALYNSFDVLLMTSQAEGWGLPVAEAMACGVPCIVPDFASFDSRLGWPTAESVIRVPCPTRCMSAPMNGDMHTVGAVPDVRGVVRSLNLLYRNVEYRQIVGGAGLAQIRKEEYQWENVGKRMVEVFQSVVHTRENSSTLCSST